MLHYPDIYRMAAMVECRLMGMEEAVLASPAGSMAPVEPSSSAVDAGVPCAHVLHRRGTVARSLGASFFLGEGS